MEVVAPGLWRLALSTPTLPPATTTNTLVVAGQDVAVIEPATPEPDEQARLDQLIGDLAAAGRKLVAVLITHHHADHVGYASALAARHGVPICAHPATADRVAFAIERRIGHGDRLDLGDGVALRAAFTPGHAPGHLCYVEERSGIAHVGDMVAGEGTILIDPYDGGDMAQYLASLMALDELGLAALVPAHGPVQHDPHAILERYVRHRLAREASILDAIAGGAHDMAAIVAVAYDDTPSWLWPLAERSAEAHLRKLVAEARVGFDGDAWRAAPGS